MIINNAEKMNRIKTTSILLFSLLLMSMLLFIAIPKHENHNRPKEENEERPDQAILSGEEKEMFTKYLDKRANSSIHKSNASDDFSHYANGKLIGTWQVKNAQTGWYGYRVDNSAYDSLRNVFYVVSYAGHLYKLEYQQEIKWTLLNHKIQLNPPDNSAANPIFMGTLLTDSTFRLIRSNESANRMEFSDDEGKTWLAGTGARVTQSWSNQAFEISTKGEKTIVLHTYDSNYHHLYFSYDNGKTYTESSLSFPISTYDVRIAKPFYTNNAYLWVWGKSSKKISIYKYNETTNDFVLTINSGSTINGTNLSSIAASYYNGNYHFYLATINPKYSVYYSADEGKTWVQKNAGHDRAFEVMCPNKPNTLISGFEDMQISSDYGANWTAYDHKLGWDLQHLRTFEKAGGKPITLAGLDFGCYISESPENKESYIWCNNGASYAMHYDAVSSENFNSIYMANQDRGTTAYLDSGNKVNTLDIDGTDVLRVCYANHETSVWSWFYYGRIKHRFNFPSGKAGEAVYDGLGNWWAAPIIASPNPAEDAIYAAYGSNLQIFSFDASSNSISRKDHSFNFKTNFGAELGGFGYAELNRNLWYATLTNGLFCYSTNAGESWTKSSYMGVRPRANDQTYNYAKNQIVIKASEIDTNKVYYSGVGNYFLVSVDGGKNFSMKNRGLNIYRMRDFCFSPDEKYIFAACSYGGAWVYSVDDDYWYQMNDEPIPSVDFTDVQFIKNKNCVRFSSFGSGILDFTLNKKFNSIEAPGELKAILTSENNVELSWIDLSTNEDGFIIERAIKGDFNSIDTVLANITSYTDTNVEYNQTCYYRIKAFKNDSVSFHSNLAYLSIPQKGIINPANWIIVDFDSEETAGENAPASFAIDNNTSTFWHTAWKNAQPNYPHHLTIDLGKVSTVAGFRYLPRQDGNTNGQISDYAFYVSNNLTTWGTPKVNGKFMSGSSWKEAIFAEPVTGRYVKFVALSEINGNFYASAAEIAILYQIVPPDAPINLYAQVVNESIIIIRWVDNSSNESGFKIEQLIENKFVVIDSVASKTISYAIRDLKPSTTYQFRVRAYNSGGDSEPTAAVEATTKASTGLNELSVNWKVYPNPCVNKLYIELSSLNHSADINIVDINGKIILSKFIEKGTDKVELTVDHLPKGYYFIELKSNNKIVIQKFSKN